MNRPSFAMFFFVCVAFAPTAAAQTNLLQNPNANLGTQNWSMNGKAAIEEFNGEKVFVVRDDDDGRTNGFYQDVDLSSSDAGKYALLIGCGSSERINADGAITGLPYLYGYMLSSKTGSGARIIEYLQGQKMLANARIPDAWVTMYGIFQVPNGTIAIRFFLNQASRRGVPPNGSAARFNNIGLYLFDSKEAAVQFVKESDKPGNDPKP